MARGGKRRGAGRPTEPDAKVALLVRVRPETRRLIEKGRGTRSLSAYAESLLLEAIHEPPKADRATHALMYLLGQAPVILRSAERLDGSDFDWRNNRTDFDALRSALLRVLDRFQPDGDFDAKRYALFESPEDAGRIVSSIIMTLLSNDAGESAASARARNAPAGSIYYAYPRAAQDLGISNNAKGRKR